MSTPITANTTSLIDKAVSQIGYSENPPNSNKTKYCAWYGMIGPWCAMWMSWVHFMSGNPLPHIRTSKGFAFVPDVVAYAKRTGQWRPVGTYEPKTGDHVVFSFGGKRPDHIGFVELNLGNGSVQTIEGNTNGAGSRTGGSVLRKIRRSGIVGYVAVQAKAVDKPITIEEDDDMASYIQSSEKIDSKGNLTPIGNRPIYEITRTHYRELSGSAFERRKNLSALGGKPINLQQMHPWALGKFVLDFELIKLPMARK